MCRTRISAKWTRERGNIYITGIKYFFFSLKLCCLLWRSLAQSLSLPIQKVEPFTATLNGAGVQHQSGIAGWLMAQEKRVSCPYHSCRYTPTGRPAVQHFPKTAITLPFPEVSEKIFRPISLSLTQLTRDQGVSLPWLMGWRKKRQFGIAAAAVSHVLTAPLRGDIFLPTKKGGVPRYFMDDLLGMSL